MMKKMDGRSVRIPKGCGRRFRADNNLNHLCRAHTPTGKCWCPCGATKETAK